MTEKRFKLLYSKLDNGMFIDKEKKFDDIFVDKEFQKIGLIKIVDLLNDLNDENIELHIQNDFLKDENQHMRDLVNENEQLKKELNYIQNSISEHIKHQKTELGQNALKEIIEDYNEWLLGHKELEE